MKTYEIAIPNTSQRVWYWYDRQLRLWTVIRVLEDGDQIGEAQHGMKSDLGTLITFAQKDAQSESS